jgi:hypothetical protein
VPVGMGRSTTSRRRSAGPTRAARGRGATLCAYRDPTARSRSRLQSCRRCMALTSLEPRLALRKEGGHTLAGVLRLAATQMRDRFAIEERAEVARRGEIHVLLLGAEARERSMGDPPRGCFTDPPSTSRTEILTHSSCDARFVSACRSVGQQPCDEKEIFRPVAPMLAWHVAYRVPRGNPWPDPRNRCAR